MGESPAAVAERPSRTRQQKSRLRNVAITPLSDRGRFRSSPDSMITWGSRLDNETGHGDV
ncbi:hypothetical protein C5E45_28990 [Nocardia nova]|uniref:Uncharacterized protein n=1 Tax=Nocardia nova TaxID=37330 RepID=A0A2S6AI07_9NOCA|nr:hypothetical protein C5E41_24655 [Nocardia nova]PPJ34863.1 hypothetical protein C5E45_28990 [Nocardia nova]